MSRQVKHTTKAQRRAREWAVRAAVWLLILAFVISAVGAVALVAVSR
jgi:hypothetical protein